MGIYTRILESLNLSEEKPLTPRQKAQKAGLVSKGGGAWAKEKGGICHLFSLVSNSNNTLL
ncbi:MAG: hypothetical protein CFH43_00899 [Proteobacteria bacterium]|nr:MAG: hypothetical protein CFH43_00899 [Pseudomonadota bacterium]